MIFDQWTVWKRAFIVNALGAVGVGLGFASSEAKLSPKYNVPIAVFVVAFLNLMFLIVRPRSLAARAEGKPKVAAIPLLIEVVQERPLIALLVVLQLIAVSRSATAAVTILQVASLRSLLDPSDLGFWMVVYSAVMTLVAGIWLASAVGIWCSRSWAWWLALLLNGLAASITAVLQLLDWHSYVLDIGAITAVVLLLLPTVRNGTGHTGRQPLGA
jgi:Na+/melibiose symporter-like transporter